MAKIKLRVSDIRPGRVDIVGLESDLRRGPFRQYIDRKGVVVLQAAQRFAPVSRIKPRPPHSTMPPQNPGALKRSLYAKATTVDRLPAVEIGSKSPVIGYVIQGTLPHVITHRYKKTLAFWQDGAGFRYPKSVMHPGTKPNDFLGRALRAAGPR